MTIEKCRTCKFAFTTGKDKLYCKKSLADKDDCGEYEMTEINMTTQVTVIAESIIQQVREEQDKFIFETVEPYVEEMTKMIISKKILCRALQCFQEEHFEEYMALRKESEEEK